MNIVVAGGGRVGFHVARLLSSENHDVTVIECDPNRLEFIDSALDARCVLGMSTSVMLLKQAGVDKTDLFVSTTGKDEENLISAATAKGLGAKQVLARADNLTYVESNILYESILGIDYILSPDALTAMEIAKYVEHPGMVGGEELGRGSVIMRQVRVDQLPNGTRQSVRDLELPPNVLLGIVNRNGKTTIPKGDTIIEINDLVTFVGTPDGVSEAQRIYHGTEPKVESVVIMGGSTIGLRLAQVLERSGRAVKIIDWDLQRCKELAASLKKAKVVCADATSRSTLEQEHIEATDLFVATTGDDERNIMASILAEEVGVKRSVVVVHQPDFAPLVARLGIDHAVTPRTSFANRVVKLVHQKTFSSSAVIEEGQVEILEFSVQTDSPVHGKQIQGVRFPEKSLVSMVLRGKDVIVPKGDTHLLVGDSVFVIVTPDAIEAVQKLFKK